MLFINFSFGQRLFIDTRLSTEADAFSCFFDTLESYGANVYIGDSVIEADLIWFITPFDTQIYNLTSQHLNALREQLFAGKPLLISVNAGGCNEAIDSLLEMLYGYSPIRVITVRPPNTPWDSSFSVTMAPANLMPIISVDDSIGLCLNLGSIEIVNDYNTFPLLVSEDTIYGIISYPLLNNITCGPLLIIIIGNHCWENLYHTPHPYPSYPSRFVRSSIQFGKKLILSLLNCGGYHFRPCAVPEGFILGDTTYCEVIPNPFTPNNDGTNDYCVFAFPNITLSPAVIRIYDIHSVLVKDIQVPLGWAAKSAARWYGKDNSGNPVPQGVYLYEIEQNGEVICTGAVTVAR